MTKNIKIPKRTLEDLYLKERLSLSQIAKKYQCSASCILKKLRKYDIKSRTYSEASTIYPKKYFEGDLLKKAYMIGFRLGDLHVSIGSGNSEIIKISSSTTKKAQLELIKSVFGCYGHFYVWKKEDSCSISCNLHKSFSFLLSKKDDIPEWVLKNKNTFFSFLAGYTDAEGCIKINQGRARYRVGSYDKKLLEKVYLKLEELKIYPRFRLETKKGTIYCGIIKNGDFWRISVSNKYALLKLLEFLEPHIRHGDKLEDLKRAKSNILERNKKFGMKGTKKDDYEKVLCHYPNLLH